SRYPGFYVPACVVEHRHAAPVANYTNDSPNSWIAVDLGAARLVPDHYCLRHDLHSPHYLRTWELQASEDGAAWATLRRHAGDAALKAPMAEAAWPIDAAAAGGRAYR